MKFTLVTAIILGVVSNGMCGDVRNISCYAGEDVKEGFNSSGKIKPSTKVHDACMVSSTVGKPGAKRDSSTQTIAYCTEMRNKTCAGKGMDKCIEKTDAVCYCVTDLCNNAPAAIVALMPIIVMALIAKFII